MAWVTPANECLDAGHETVGQARLRLVEVDELVLLERLTKLADQREPFPNARRSANWTCVGLCAHESALKGGELVRLPEFTLRAEPVST